MRMTLEQHKARFLLLLEIQEGVAIRSVTMDENTRQALLTMSRRMRNDTVPRLTMAHFNYGIDEFFTYWNENITPDVELFWDEIRQQGLPFERKDPLAFAFAKGRLRLGDQYIAARKHWAAIRQMEQVKARYTTDQILQIDEMIAADEKKRHELLKKILIKGNLPDYQYLKFGECMAYFSQCGLWGQYFTQQQVERLREIWHPAQKQQ